MIDPDGQAATDAPSTAQPIVLSYAFAPRWWQTAAARRWSLLLLLIALALLGWRLGPHAWRFARESYWQRECMHFNPSPSPVVYERLSFGSAKPTVAAPYMDGDCPEVNALSRQATAKASVQFGRHQPVHVGCVPVCWVRFLQSTKNWSSFLTDESVVFCHELGTPAGGKRLVTVELPTFLAIGDLLPRHMRTTIFSPTTWNGSHKFVWGRLSILGSGSAPPTTYLRRPTRSKRPEPSHHRIRMA